MKDPTHPSERSMPSPTQELPLSSAFLPFHFVWSNFPSILFKLGRALPPPPPPPAHPSFMDISKHCWLLLFLR